VKSSILMAARLLDFVDVPADGVLAAKPPLPLQCWGLTKHADHARPHRCISYMRGGVSGRYLTCFRHRHREADAQRIKARLDARREALREAAMRTGRSTP